MVIVALTALTGCQPTPPPDGSATTGASTSPETSSSGTPTESAGTESSSPSSGTGSSTGAAASGKVGHVFVINLENKGYESVWGSGSVAPYLSQTLRGQGVLLTQYYAIAHLSLPNYLAQISGQGPNDATRKDCGTYEALNSTRVAAQGQVQGTGCVYPASVPTLAGQLGSVGKTWKGYMEDMNSSCRHPQLGARDGSQGAKVGDQYATRHNPFVYFRSITSSPECQSNVVDFSNLASDLGSVGTTPNLSYITPNLCNDGHDSPCVDGRPGGLVSADAWLKQQVPMIMDSPAFKQDGVLVITFDEAEGDATGPAGIPGGTAGGRIGALVLSPLIRGGTSSGTMYNHYSLLASIEDIFSLPYLGYAGASGLNRFGSDVFNGRP